jgi:hypothetical protein
VLIDGSPQLIRLAARRHKHFVRMPCGAGLRRAAFTRCETRLTAITYDRIKSRLRGLSPVRHRTQPKGH